MEESKNSNSYENQRLRGIKRKLDAIIQKGGKCEVCGYSKNISALDFHHIDPSTKLFQIDARTFANTNLDALQVEIDKCSLLCANCHREMHHQDLEIALLSFEQIDKKSFSNVKDKFSICPTCGEKFKKVSGKTYCSPKCRGAAKIKDKNYPTTEGLEGV